MDTGPRVHGNEKMKCSDCGHSVGKKAKFCSECGNRLSASTKRTHHETNEPRSLVAEDTREKSENNPALDNKESVSPKKPNDFGVSMQKQKKKRNKGNNEKDDSSMMDPKRQSNPSQKESVRKRSKPSGSEESKDAMDEEPDSHQDEASHTKSLDSSMPSTPGAEPPEHTTGAVRDQTTDREEASKETSGRPGESGKDKPNPPGDQIVKRAPSDTPTERPVEESKSVMSPTDVGKKSKSTNKNMVNTREPVLDHNANVESNGKQQGKTNQTGKNKSKQKRTEQKMVFGPQSPTKLQAQDIGSSVDPEGPGECAEVQDSGDKQDSDGAQIPVHTPVAPPPKRSRSGRMIDAENRFTVCFHAVLSKDFKIDLDKDQIFVRVGPPLGTWTENTAELSVIRELEEHGFLVEGSLTACKKQATMKSIPYKYVVYKAKKKKYDFEFIYKQDSTAFTNRCLFVKTALLDSNGDWHQYDDIICVQPTKTHQRFAKIIDTIFGLELREGLIKGRQIAGNVMLETIFKLVESWTDVDLRNFWLQLNQFFEVYSKPFVYEDKEKRWLPLDYEEDNVKNMLKEFMVHRLFPQQEHGGHVHGLDPLRAAVVMLSVCHYYSIRLTDAECFRLCAALCLPQMKKEDFTNYWADFLREVPFLRGLPEKLAWLINVVKKIGNPNWILVLPLRHILNGTIKPFEVPYSVKIKYDHDWAGLEGLEVWTFKNMNSQQRQAIVKELRSRSYLINMDPILVHSCLYLLHLDDLEECARQINVELLDMLVVVFNKTPPEIFSYSVTAVSAVLQHIHGCLLEDKYSCFTGAYRQLCLTMIVKLLDRLCKGVKPESYGQNYPDVPLMCMNIFVLVTDFVHHKTPKSPEGKEEQQNVNNCVSQAKTIIRNWMGRSFKQSFLSKGFFPSGSAKVELQLWNNILCISFADEEYTKSWRETFSKEFKGIYQRESARKQIEYYCSEIEKLENSFQFVAGVIEKCALEAVPSLCQNKNEAQIFERIKINWKFVGLISAIIEKSWPSETPHHDDGMVLRHLLSWTAAKHIFQLYGSEQNELAKLSQEAKKTMDAAISALVAISDDLADGNIKIALLNVILEKKEAYLDLLKIAADSFPGIERYKNKDKMRRLIEWRQTEVTAVYREKDLFNTLLTMTLKLVEYMTVVVDEMLERQQVVIESERLRDFMEVHQVDILPTDNTGVVTYFQLDGKIRDMAKVLHTFQGSHLFKVCWEKVAKVAAEEMKANNSEDEDEVANIKAASEKIHERIFQPAYSHYQSIYELLKGGQIKLKDINQLFGTFKGNYEGLTRELLIMNKIEERSDEQWIHSRVQQIEQYHELHLAVASAEMIMIVKETLCLQGDFGVLETLKEVNHVDFQNEPLNRINSDLMKAKKILVDINEPRRLCLEELGLRRHFVKWVKNALKDINELKVFVDLAAISAGENDMDVDRVACFHDAVLGYSSMLYELKPDSDFNVFQEVVKKLWRALENDPNLPKKLRDMACHLKWLKIVKDSHGSVELSSLKLASAINNKGIYLISAPREKRVSLDTVLKLQILEENDEGQQMRCYSLEDLRELQNKLMLMSGKGDQGQNEVDHFTEVFDGVQRLCETFITLYTAGNPLVQHWEAQIRCCLNSQEPSIVMDFHLDNVDSVVLEGSIDTQLTELCRKMEKGLKDWVGFVREQRSQYYYLNCYTAEQIVYLCSKLSQQNLSDVEDQVLMMLSLVKPDCTAPDLRQVKHTLQYELLTDPEEANDVKIQTVVAPENDMDPRVDSAVQKFDLIWDAYMADMKNFMPHILDIKSFGRLLQLLAEKASVSNVAVGLVNRQLPKGLVPGNPNLIVCPHSDVLTSCLSIYMSSEDQALPTYDEVLLCTPSTPYEQVEIFLRRCLSTGYKGQKIYSLLFGDLLTYDVSSKVENFFQQMKMQSRKDYRLVIICSSEREHSYIPSAFSQYRVHVIPQESVERLRQYLHRHFVVPQNRSSAAAAFKDRLCVGVVSSQRAGVGKSLYIKRLYERLERSAESSVLKCIRLINPVIDEDVVLRSLLTTPTWTEPVLFHFDVTSSVRKGLHEFLFKLLILRYLMDSEGKMWKCRDNQLYLIEVLQPSVKAERSPSSQAQTGKITFFNMFPFIFCRPPNEVVNHEMGTRDDLTNGNGDDPLMDDQIFRSETFQRPYQYLRRFHNHCDLDSFMFKGVEGSHVECLQIFLLYCGVSDPSWAELRNFVLFLNFQLRDCETSVFCNPTVTGDLLTGFKTFVVDFMILMAKDFATPSLSISDQSPGRLTMNLTGMRDEDLAPFQIRKRWETELHPYIFFNDDHESMTFIGFHLQPNGQNYVDAVDPSSRRVIKKNIMTIQLYLNLKLQGVPFNIDFDGLLRGEKIERLSRVLGVQCPMDPDETYELTSDNILKMLAIHMRFRCGIPVIIMGETGCGKTRLIKFLCELQRSGVTTENMKLVKVHGGTTSEMIYSKVREAEFMAFTNNQDYSFDSVLFFDEANTTEAISCIKEVLCDKTVRGESFTQDNRLQIIAACNPYRKHKDEMIQRLESAGLGYRVRADKTEEKLGSIPLRQLVYRVQALPPSMIPLVWDFGQLNDQTEKTYIQQIVQRVAQSKAINQHHIKMITDVLSASQKYMRQRSDECSFVSLRDVERCMQCFVWFLEHHVKLFAELEEYDKKQNAENNDRCQRQPSVRDPVVWSLVMSIGVCYHACLENKEKYRQIVSKSLPQGCNQAKVMQEISLMQDLLLSGVPMGKTIARNSALKENFFMMVLCIELRIPLFLVGKPGSSKSLSKTLVADAMQGQAAHSDLYKMLKQVDLVSFQCSPHSTPEGIINIFKQCGRFQKGKNLAEYTRVVVLDEIGLAEDSPKMPLKTLHPLLEEGCIDDDPLPHKKVGFIGISNWALDPAKMNRGIFVSRGDPDEKELIETAKGICQSDGVILEMIREFFQPFARAYLKICRGEGKGFFGLRDYYSLIKMIFAVARSSQRKPTSEETVKAVLRNFSGKQSVDTVAVFTTWLPVAPNLENINAIEFVRENIQAAGHDEECRYLLVLTRNCAALKILQQTVFSENSLPEIIFGSSFLKDQEYTQICRNINRVKICMETGQTVVLLNLQNLYESLYDALNQYYVCLGDQKYVDLGLGSHRVKCRVHRNFRLIVIEERDVVYKQFPIPLINRLEKHYLDIHTVLKAEQKRMVEELEEWVALFVSLKGQNTTYRYQQADVFIGYHSDMCASVVLQATEKHKDIVDEADHDRRVLEEAKLLMLKFATPDSVVRLECTDLPRVESEHLAMVYFQEQSSSCLADFIDSQMRQDNMCGSSFTEVTTFSRLLTASELEPLKEMAKSVELLSLQQFETEHSFLKKIRTFLTSGKAGDTNRFCNKILIIQCDFDEASDSTKLIISAKHSSFNEINKLTQQNTGSKVFVYFITRLPRMEGGTSYNGFHGGVWRAAHIDDLRRSKDMVSDIKALQNMTISQMFERKMSSDEAMEIESMYTEEQEEVDAEEIAVDTTALVHSCVQSAVGMLRDQGDSGLRSAQRVDILLTLLCDHDEIKAEFLQTVKAHIHSMLLTLESNTMEHNWVIKEASNFDALQEGGTFRHTLWKRVQTVVVPLLAQLVSVMDRDQNLDILFDEDCNEPVKRLWLDIFRDDKLLEIPHLTPDHSGDRKTLLVQNSILQNKMSSSLPFSWRIRNYLEELWVLVLQQEGRTQQEFDELFWKTPLGRYVGKADLEMQVEFYQRYLQDFVCMTMNVTCPTHLKLFCSALNCCVNELRLQLDVTSPVISFTWVHAAYHHYKNRMQNLSRMVCIEPQVLPHLLRNQNFATGSELVLDVYAALACVEYLEPRQLDTDEQRQAWLQMVKKLQVPIELVCSEECLTHYGEKSQTIVRNVQAGWSRIFSLSLFVENVLLGIDKVEKKLTPVVVEHTRQFGQILEKSSDLKTHEAFEQVITLLKTCKEKAVECLFRFGSGLCSICMGDPQDPLCLPCDHIYCQPCLKQWLKPSQMSCPNCKQQVNNDFQIVPSEAVRGLVNQHARFREQCNAFFIDLVTRMCFKDNSPPCSDVIRHLLSFLIVEAKSMPFLQGKCKPLTKMLSPFDDSVDKIPVVRSLLLKLLLKYSFDEVQGYLQEHLSHIEQSKILEKMDKTELYLLYINCLEDSMYERFQFRSADLQRVCLQDESSFLISYLETQSAETATVAYLQQVARVRMDLDMAASLIVEKLKPSEAQNASPNGTKEFLDSVEALCRKSGNEWYRVYLIRKVGSQCGVDFVSKLLKVDAVRWLFPQEILQKSNAPTRIDQYLVCGEQYQTIRNAVAEAVMKGITEGLDQTCQSCACLPQQTTVYLLLALHREVAALFRDATDSFGLKQELLKALLAFIQTSKFLTNPAVKAFAEALVRNQIGPLRARPGASAAHYVLVDLTIHLAAILLCGHHGVLVPLQQLAHTPANMKKAFLPTMPNDLQAAVREALGPLQWYHCPKGHPIVIGECGQPMETSQCLDCRAPIGGTNHRPLEGFHMVNVGGDRTETGHVLGDPNRRDNADMLDTKNLSPVPFTVIRMLTHMALLLGVRSHHQSVSAIIKPEVPDPGAFLHAHLTKDLQHLIRRLGKGTDDTIRTVHLLINSLLDPHSQQSRTASFDNLLSTDMYRNGWEMEISNNIIAPQLKHLDRQLKEVNALIRADSCVSASPVMMLLVGDPRLFLASVPKDSLIHCSTVWSCREKISLQSLTHIVELDGGKDSVPVLWRFLHKEAELRLVKHLPDILALQRNLVKRFQNLSVLTGTIKEFLNTQNAAGLKAWYKKHIGIFLTTWNQLRVSLATNGEIKIPAEYCQSDMDHSSDFSFLLPRRQGPGLCSTALISYLISLHNNMVYCMDKHMGEETSYRVSPVDLTDLHVIRYELERDLMPLILSNTQYSIERGQESLQEYNFVKIQQQLVSRFLLGKPLITLQGIPTLVNRYDRNEVILRDLKAKVQQEPLQMRTMLAVAAELQSYSEVCEALSTVEVAMGFLSMTSEEPHMQLSTYLEEVLQMGNQMPPHILKALSMCCLKHCATLWQLLSSLKSENMLQLKRDPFPGVSELYKQALGEAEHRLLTAFFTKNSTESFLLEMHEFLVLVLKNPKAEDTFKPEWGLAITLISYMERKDLEVSPEMEEFPKELLLAHYVEAWKFIVAFKQERQRQ